MIVGCWSGPRNISTALMRSWSSRTDTFVTDEPFYAHYLKETKIKHPMHKEIINKFNNVKLTPTSIILDENGYVINTIIGEINFNEFNKKLIKLLK